MTSFFDSEFLNSEFLMLYLFIEVILLCFCYFYIMILKNQIEQKKARMKRQADAIDLLSKIASQYALNRLTSRYPSGYYRA